MSSQVSNLRHEPKLTWSKVNAIRRDYRWHSTAVGCAGLAKRYGVSANTIHKIIHGKIWRVRPGDGNVPLPRLTRPRWKDVLTLERRAGEYLLTLSRLMR